MATQLAFSRPQVSPPSSPYSNHSVRPNALSSRPRTAPVTSGSQFALEAAYEEPQRRHVAFTIPASRQPTAAAPRRPRKQWSLPTAATNKPKPTKPIRRPAWESDARQGPSLFDATLKKSVLFQPNAREKQAQALVEQRKTATQRQRSSPAAQLTIRVHRSVEATRRRRPGPSIARPKPQQPQQQRRRPEQDFVRRNIEQISGRSYSQYATSRSSDRRASQPRGNVFERLSRPPIDLSLVRRYSSAAEPSPLRIRSPSPRHEESRSSPALSNRQASPVTATRSPPRSSPNQHESDVSPRPSSRRSNSPRRSPSPALLETRREDPIVHQHQQTVAAKVFDMLDEKQRGRVGVSQILHGLRFLGLPATHNQISDYVYLIHDGVRTSIDLREWEILVGTLDAASQPSSIAPRSRSPSRVSSVSARSPYAPSHLHSTSDRFHNGSAFAESPVSARSHYAAGSRSPAEQQPRQLGFQQMPSPGSSSEGEDRYLQEIQVLSLDRRIDSMFQQAEETAALRWQHEPGNNQVEDDAHPDRILKRASSVVYSLKASLFPLVQQAEATLKEIQKRHGTRLSLFLPPKDLTTIAQNSDLLANALLDDLLLDTVQLLNDEDRAQSQHQMQLHQSDQLDRILDRITEMEAEENKLVQQGLVLGFSVMNQPQLHVLSPENHFKVAAPPEKSTVESQSERDHLVLPLEVIMNVNVPTSPAKTVRFITDATAAAHDQESADALELSSMPLLQQSVRGGDWISTSIVQGRIYNSIEKARHKFERHRRLAEASLSDSGMNQAAVIEILEEMLTQELVEDCAREIEESVCSLSDTLATTLV